MECEGLQAHLPICCEALVNEVVLEVTAREATVDESSPVQSQWMQGPVIAAFEARLASLEQEKRAAAALESKLEALEREKQAAVVREDYDVAKQCKQEISMLREMSNVPGKDERRVDMASLGAGSPPAASFGSVTGRRQWPTKCAKPTRCEKVPSTSQASFSTKAPEGPAPRSSARPMNGPVQSTSQASFSTKSFEGPNARMPISNSAGTVSSARLTTQLSSEGYPARAPKVASFAPNSYPQSFLLHSTPSVVVPKVRAT